MYGYILCCLGKTEQGNTISMTRTYQGKKHKSLQLGVAWRSLHAFIIIVIIIIINIIISFNTEMKNLV